MFLFFCRIFVRKLSSSVPLAFASTLAEFLPKTKKDVQIQNSFFVLTFDGATGKLKTMENKNNGLKANVSIDLMYYESHPGNNSQVNTT